MFQLAVMKAHSTEMWSDEEGMCQEHVPHLFDGIDVFLNPRNVLYWVPAIFGII